MRLPGVACSNRWARYKLCERARRVSSPRAHTVTRPPSPTPDSRARDARRAPNYQSFRPLSSRAAIPLSDPRDACLNGLVVSALGIRARGPRFVPPFHWVASLGKLFTHVASPVSQLQETGVQKGVFGT